MSQVPLIDFSEQYQKIRAELQGAVSEVFSTQQFILKDRVPHLEEAVAKKVGAPYAIGVASGSDALYLALVALGVGAGDEVITTPFTFFATAGAISRTGAKPIFVDVDAKTFNLDPQLIEKAITPKTKAIIPVHLFGLPCEMDEILAIAKKHSLKVIEDAAQSFGASYKGRQTGSIGDAGCYSFFPTKNLGGAGDGGMVVVRDEAVADRIRILRVHGSRKKYIHEIIGINSRLDELQAAVVSVKMKYIDEWNASRQKSAAEYTQGLAGLPIQCPVCPKGYVHTYHLYSIVTNRRDELSKHLTREGVGNAVYYPLPLHRQPCYLDLGYKDGDLPVSERLSREILSLPMFPELKEADLRRVIGAIRSFF